MVIEVEKEDISEMQETMNAILEATLTEKTAKTVANFMAVYVKELQAKGFTRKEALALAERGLQAFSK